MFVMEKASWGRTIAVERAEKNAFTTRSYRHLVYGKQMRTVIFRIFL